MSTTTGPKYTIKLISEIPAHVSRHQIYGTPDVGGTFLAHWNRAEDPWGHLFGVRPYPGKDVTHAVVRIADLVPPKPKRKRKPGARYTVIPVGDVLPTEPRWLVRDRADGLLHIAHISRPGVGPALQTRILPRAPSNLFAVVKARRPRAYYWAKRVATEKARIADALGAQGDAGIRVDDVVDYTALPVGCTFEPTDSATGFWFGGAYNRVKTAEGHKQTWTDGGGPALCLAKGYGGPCRITDLP